MINYTVYMSEGEEIEVEDHCFGGMTNFCEFLSDEWNLRGYSDDEDFMNNVSYISYQLENLDSQDIDLITDSFSWIKGCSGSNGYADFHIDADETWDELILKMTFIRNLDTYTHFVYKELVNKGFSVRVSAIISQMLEESMDSFHPYKDSEYSWLCPFSIGEQALVNLINDKPVVFNQKKLNEASGYLRDSRLADAGVVFNEGSVVGDLSWGADNGENNHYMKLCRTHCIVGDTPVPFFNNSAVGENGTLLIGKKTSKQVVFNRLSNWLQLKGL